jgi:ABC-type Fe3+/spermidine/putrescine transport system ATPase subunit
MHAPAQGSAASLEVAGLVKTYRNGVTVGPVDFTVRRGEFFSLLGPSGCGKSTTLRCIAGFEDLTSGRIDLADRRIDRLPPFRRELGLVFQSFALFPHLTVAQNVGFGLGLRKVPRAESERRVGETLALLGLDGLAERMPSQISGGQQQRVALARSLVLEPPLLLLDEPLSSLDLKLREQMREELRALQRRLGQTMIFVTHDQTEALAMSDRLAVLSEGRIEQIGTPREIYAQPATRFVAEFIGQANLFEATVARVADGAAEFRLPGDAALRGAPPPDDPMRPGEARCLVIRPENVRILPGGDGDGEGVNTFPGEVVDHEYLGGDTILRVRVDALGTLVASFKTTRDALARLEGGRVAIAMDPEDVVVLRS